MFSAKADIYNDNQILDGYYIIHKEIVFVTTFPALCFYINAGINMKNQLILLIT